nr:hypothetical protein HK105_001817 [Polyrhizophydium stewartii]
MIEEQLVAGLADAFYARIDLTVYEVDSPVVLAWLRTIECLRAMSLGAVRLKHIGIDKQKWLKAARWGELDEALVHLRLSATLGMPRPFQTRFVELLRDLTSAAVAVWTRWRNCRPRGSGVYEDSVGTPHPSMRARFERLARAFDELPECFFGMDAESEDITAYYAIVCRALADMCDRDSGMPYFAIHLARRVTKHVEQNPGVCNARQLVGIRDFALSMPSRFDDSLLPPLFAYRPIPRFFFRSTKPVQFKVEISPLPKPGHALVLRRRMMLVVRFEGSLSFSEADAPKWRDGAAVRFDVSILGPDGVEIMATSTTCTTQPPAGYFSTSCTISTDTLTPRFQVSVRMSLTTPPAMLAPGVAARSWRLGHAESFSVRLLEADAPL